MDEYGSNYLCYSENHIIGLDESIKIITKSGAVYRGTDTELGRTIAVKMQSYENDSEATQIIREVKTLIKLEQHHINIPVVYGYYDDKGAKKIWILMQWINGDTLEKLLNRKNRIPVRQFLRYVIELCNILVVLENESICHRDIKPSNIIISDGKVFLIDFDISMNFSMRNEGSDFYRAPEMDRKSVNASRQRVDIFSVGVIMYQYFTGEQPRLGEHYKRDPLGKSSQWKYYKEPKELDPSINDDINSIIMKAMALSPEERFRSASELKSALERTRNPYNVENRCDKR